VARGLFAQDVLNQRIYFFRKLSQHYWQGTGETQESMRLGGYLAGFSRRPRVGLRAGKQGKTGDRALLAQNLHKSRRRFVPFVHSDGVDREVQQIGSALGEELQCD